MRKNNSSNAITSPVVFVWWKLWCSLACDRLTSPQPCLTCFCCLLYFLDSIWWFFIISKNIAIDAVNFGLLKFWQWSRWKSPLRTFHEVWIIHFEIESEIDLTWSSLNEISARQLRYNYLGYKTLTRKQGSISIIVVSTISPHNTLPIVVARWQKAIVYIFSKPKFLPPTPMASHGPPPVMWDL